MSVKWILAVLMLCASACTAASNGEVLLLGDDARLSLLGTAGVDAPRKDAPASEVASAAATAKHGVVVIDAANGPLPITREHILIARQAKVPSLSILVVNAEALNGLPDKATLIDLEVAAVRELMDKYELDGNAVPLFVGEGGLQSILRQSRDLPARDMRGTPSPPRKNLSGSIYMLSALESPGTEAIGDGDVVTLWVAGQTTSATVDARSTIAPGDLADLELATDASISAMPGERFLFERGGRVVAIGVVTN